ncbi:hypothetical protein M2158_008342 [Streptomyces sp. SAI-144]|uniref:hypothetical protein n=1 Tax=Streptomyces sp. SAI-144 TaxID=2940544 RepID=UPI00247331A1|nr:hypothetical protein [Streptomyces sp. SAI-144]MDH6439801.1 hypothetical protein [Streptomyces sp. SAI-144]
MTQEGLVADLRAGRMEPRVLGEGLISTAAFGPIGTRPAVGDVLDRLTLWDGAARARLGVLDGTTSVPTADATGAVTALAFSHDGRTLAVAGSAGSLQLRTRVRPRRQALRLRHQRPRAAVRPESGPSDHRGLPTRRLRSVRDGLEDVSPGPPVPAHLLSPGDGVTRS